MIIKRPKLNWKELVKDLVLPMIFLVLSIGLMFVYSAHEVRGAAGQDIIVEFSPEDFQLLQKVIDFKGGFSSKSICDQDYCNFSIALNTKLGVVEEKFIIPSHYEKATDEDGDGIIEYETVTYDMPEYLTMRNALVHDYLMVKFIEPQKYYEKEKEEYLEVEEGNVIVKEKK